MQHTVELLRSQFTTHDVRRFLVTRPEGFDFRPGQGVELALDEPEWRDEGRPFTPTSLQDDKLLEFTIKRYPGHEGVTDRLHTLRPGAKLRMSEPFGTIRHRGPGVFLAGGAGVTPFLAILRTLERDGTLEGHSMIFSNKKREDVLCERELRHAFGDRLLLTLTREDAADRGATDYDSRRIDKRLLEEEVANFDQRFYVCGPPQFVEDLQQALDELGADSDRVVFEQ